MRAWPSAPTARPSPPDTASAASAAAAWCCGTWPRANAWSTAPLAVTEGYVQSVAFSPDGKTIAAGYGDGDGAAAAWCCGTWPRAAPGRRAALAVNEGIVQSVAFSPDGKTIAAGYSGDGDVGGVVLWDVAGRQRLVGAPWP